MTRFNTAGGVWGEGSSRIDGVIASGTEAEWWKVAEEIHPEGSTTEAEPRMCRSRTTC